MTSKTNRYVELSDILSLRFECKQCGAAISLPLSNVCDYQRLESCPNCTKPWIRRPDGSSIKDELKNAIGHLAILRGLLEPASKFKTELSLFLEVPSDRASDSKV
jgi:hypothetical protein